MWGMLWILGEQPCIMKLNITLWPIRVSIEKSELYSPSLAIVSQCIVYDTDGITKSL